MTGQIAESRSDISFLKDEGSSGKNVNKNAKPQLISNLKATIIIIEK